MKNSVVSKLIAMSVIVLLLAGSMFGCSPPEGKTGDGDEWEAADIEGAPKSLKIGIVTFLSGPASPLGMPARNAATLIAKALNDGEVPLYGEHLGIGGVPIELVIIDEAGTVDAQTKEYRRLVLDEKVDMVIGYISSANCLGIAPIAEELKTLTVIFDAGTLRLFEEDDYKYVFRPVGHLTMDAVGAARYIVDNYPDATEIAGIHQDYAFGHDNWEAFEASIKALKPDVKITTALFPAVYAGDYSAEISSLLSTKPDIVHTSLWGGDQESFIQQAIARGLVEQSTIISTCGQGLLPKYSTLLKEGIVIGARGPHAVYGPRNELDNWLMEAYVETYGDRPVFHVYHMAQSLFAVKYAYEKALAANNYEIWPEMDEVIDAFRYAEFDTPSGLIKMSLSNGHQAVEPSIYGITSTKLDPTTGELIIENIKEYSPEEVNPPEGINSLDWIRDILSK